MSNLLTPSESHAFQSFLTAIDHPNDDLRPDSSEWNPHNASTQHYAPDIPQVQQGREALAKATKDLMSLDAEGWNSAPMMQQFPQQQYANFMPQQPSHYGYDMHNHPQSAPNLIHQQQQQSHRNASFPFLSKQRSQHPVPPLTHSQSSPPHTLHAHAHIPQPISISPLHTMSGAQDPRSGSNLHSFTNMGSPPTTSSSTTSTFSFGSNGSMYGSSSTSTLPSPAASASQRASPGASSGKRGSDSGPSSSFPNKRSRPSPPSTSVTASVSNKAALLSPSQKKANHIQSEQKRRANIRRGYEALCETVPTLREAIRSEEEAQNNRETGKAGKAKRGRRGKIDETTGEKIDGRAGPRSENIVLGKTIDYINELLNDRQALLERLERARSALGPNHPSCQPPSDCTPLWEQEWKGGSGKDGDAEEDDEEED